MICPPEQRIPSTACPDAHVDAAAGELVDPRADPDVARRPVQNAIGTAACAAQVEEQLKQDVTAGACAHLPCPRRHQRARGAVGQELAKRGTANVGVDEVPPALVLPLAVAALVAAREEREQALYEEGVVLRRDPERRREVEEKTTHEPEVLERFGQMRDGEELVASAWAMRIRVAATRLSKTPFG